MASNHDNATDCAACPAGQFENADTCDACPSGKYQPSTTGETSCIDCAVGKYRDGNELASAAETLACEVCESGRFQPTAAG
jgi:hypothetical protein